jgi:hypothetical protein
MPARKKPEAPEASDLTGDCFEAALKFIQDPSVIEFPDDYRLVHGNVAVLRQDEAVNHAWIEENDVVYEVSNRQGTAYFKETYYKQYQVTNIRSYTVPEALELAFKHGHSGPWD